MKLFDTLSKYNKKTITKSELEELVKTHSDEVLFELIQECVKQGLISPISSSKTNGNKSFPIHLKYKIIRQENTHEKELEEISKLHPILQKTGYLQKKPAEYEKHKDFLLSLNQYLFLDRRNALLVSRKERSFEIFGEEKALDDRNQFAFLSRLGITSETLLFYDTPEYCFNDYIPEKKSNMTLLICENKDIWFNIRRMMFENNAKFIFDVQIDGVVFGSGNRVCEKAALCSYTRFFGGSDVTYLYWGDIDREGLNIYLRLVRSNPNIPIRLFLPGYQKMLHEAVKTKIPLSEDKRKQIDDYSIIYHLFSEDDQRSLKFYIDANKRIPQEIVSYAVLQKCMR